MTTAAARPNAVPAASANRTYTNDAFGGTFLIAECAEDEYGGSVAGSVKPVALMAIGSRE